MNPPPSNERTYTLSHYAWPETIGPFRSPIYRISKRRWELLWRYCCGYVRRQSVTEIIEITSHLSGCPVSIWDTIQSLILFNVKKSKNVYSCGVFQLRIKKQLRMLKELPIYLSIYGSIALVGLGGFFSFLIYTQLVGPLGREISSSQGRCLHTEQHKHGINAHRQPCLE
jgi:hypothetical protein